MLWRLLAVGIIFFNVGLRLYVKARKARLRPRGTVHKPKLLMQMVWAYVFFCSLAFFEASTGYWSFHFWIAATGGCLYVLSLALQMRAFRDLGDAYSPDIEVKKEQTLVRHGLYGIIRHPLLTALILELVGVTLVFNAYGTLAFSALAFIPVIEKRRREEEKVLRNHFGLAYQHYAAEVGALFPKLGGFIHDKHA